MSKRTRGSFGPAVFSAVLFFLFTRVAVAFGWGSFESVGASLVGSVLFGVVMFGMNYWMWPWEQRQRRLREEKARRAEE